jgi:hypothetical protein
VYTFPGKCHPISKLQHKPLEFLYPQELLEELSAVQSVLISLKSNIHPTHTETTKCHGPSAETCYSGKVNGTYFSGAKRTSETKANDLST